MAEMRFTPSQQDAIFSRGGTVLVSAAAGSGKTRVLTERLMAYITDAESPADVDQFLIITFTRAAAGELRSRIMDAISERIAADPENRRLRRRSCWGDAIRGKGLSTRMMSSPICLMHSHGM